MNKRNMTLTELMNELHSGEEIYLAEKSQGSINLTKKILFLSLNQKAKRRKLGKIMSTKKDGKPKGKCFKCGQNGHWQKQLP